MNTLATIPPALVEVNKELQRIASNGLFLDRPAMRKLYNRLLELESDYPDQPGAMVIATPGLKTICAQLRGALARKGWKKIAISAPNFRAALSGGLVLGIIE